MRDLIKEAQAYYKNNSGDPGYTPTYKVGDLVYTPEYPGYQDGVTGRSSTGDLAWYRAGSPPAKVLYLDPISAVIELADGIQLWTHATHRLLKV